VRTAWSQIAFTLANVVIAAVGTALVALASTRGAVTVSDFIMFTVAVTSVQARNFGYPVAAADRSINGVSGGTPYLNEQAQLLRQVGQELIDHVLRRSLALSSGWRFFTPVVRSMPTHLETWAGGRYGIIRLRA
jgi:hypothetical protein